MLLFLTRTFLLLAAAFSLGALGGRGTRSKRRLDGGRGRPSGAALPAHETRETGGKLPGASSGLDGAPTAPTALNASNVADSKAVSPLAEPQAAADPTSQRRDVVGQPAFASFGSGFVAGVGMGDAERAASEGEPAQLAAPDLDGRTPTADQRKGQADDPLDARHAADVLDFRTVDYGNAKAAERAAAEARLGDDGWTIPDGAALPAHGSLDESPAAFKSGGGSGAVFGAPETESRAIPLGDGISVVEPRDGTASEQAEAATGTPSTAARTGDPDDLTRIRGIGPSIERLLFDHGILRLEQIAAWTETDIRWADELTGFAGRVQRESWINQAKAFVADRGVGRG